MIKDINKFGKGKEIVDILKMISNNTEEIRSDIHNIVDIPEVLSELEIYSHDFEEDEKVYLIDETLDKGDNTLMIFRESNLELDSDNIIKLLKRQYEECKIRDEELIITHSIRSNNNYCNAYIARNRKSEIILFSYDYMNMGDIVSKETYAETVFSIKEVKKHEYALKHDYVFYNLQLRIGSSKYLFTFNKSRHTVSLKTLIGKSLEVKHLKYVLDFAFENLGVSEWGTFADYLNNERKYDYKIKKREGMSGCIDYTLIHKRTNEEKYDFLVKHVKGLHISMYDKLNEGIENIWLGDLKLYIDDIGQYECNFIETDDEIEILPLRVYDDLEKPQKEINEKNLLVAIDQLNNL